MSEKILIFGATGGIGSILINNLKNYEIVGASPDYEEGRKRYGIRFFNHDQARNEVTKQSLKMHHSIIPIFHLRCSLTTTKNIFLLNSFQNF